MPPAKKPRRPEPTRAEKEKFVKTEVLRIPMELVLEWDRPVSVSEARQASRRLLEALRLDASSFHPREPFAEARLQSARAARVLKIAVGALEEEPEA